MRTRTIHKAVLFLAGFYVPYYWLLYYNYDNKTYLKGLLKK